jgi:phage tail tape-measure protein
MGVASNHKGALAYARYVEEGPQTDRVGGLVYAGGSTVEAARANLLTVLKGAGIAAARTWNPNVGRIVTFYHAAGSGQAIGASSAPTGRKWAKRTERTEEKPARPKRDDSPVALIPPSRG